MAACSWTCGAGEALDTLELIDDAGNVLLAHAHGIHDDERLRAREALLRLLRGALGQRPPVRPTA